MDLIKAFCDFNSARCADVLIYFCVVVGLPVTDIITIFCLLLLVYKGNVQQNFRFPALFTVSWPCLSATS